MDPQKSTNPVCTASAVVETSSAAKYLQQLCKHWSHKAETQFSQSTGFIQFESGNRLDLASDGSSLKMEATSLSAESLEVFKDVVDKHLLRFAFREELTITWH